MRNAQIVLAALVLVGCSGDPTDNLPEPQALDLNPPPSHGAIIGLDGTAQTPAPAPQGDAPLGMTEPLWVTLPEPQSDGYRHLEWVHLMPPDFSFAMAMSNLDDAPVVGDLDGEQIRIPGYLLPLDADMDRVYRFLVVPYVGACIHVPPPPSNQIIYAQSEEGMAEAQLWDAVYIYGTLNTEKTGTGWVYSSYVLEVDRWEPYVW